MADKECIADLKDPASLKAKFEESKSYLGRPSIQIVSNTQRFDLEKFGNETIINESNVIVRQFSLEDPNWLQTFITSHKLKDETELFNFGFESIRKMYTFDVDIFKPSLMANYPNDYKFTSAQINASDKQTFR